MATYIDNDGNEVDPTAIGALDDFIAVSIRGNRTRVVKTETGWAIRALAAADIDQGSLGHVEASGDRFTPIYPAVGHDGERLATVDTLDEAIVRLIKN